MEREHVKYPPGTIAKTWSGQASDGRVLVLGYQWFNEDLYYEVVPVNPEGQCYGESFDTEFLRD